MSQIHLMVMMIAGGQDGRGGQSGRPPRGGVPSNQVMTLGGQGGGPRLEMFHGEAMSKIFLRQHQGSRANPVHQRQL